jgi:hypothetical protein
MNEYIYIYIDSRLLLMPVPYPKSAIITSGSYLLLMKHRKVNTMDKLSMLRMVKLIRVLGILGIKDIDSHVKGSR